MNGDTKNGQSPVETLSFEESYQELQQLVEQFEKGQMRLSESVEKFERGMQLLKWCNRQLNEAEARVEKLLRRIEPTDAYHNQLNSLKDADENG